MKEAMLSLYDYLNKPAGPILGQEVANAAVKEGVKLEYRFIQTPSYTGEVLLYPRLFLDKFFGKEQVESTTRKIIPIVELYYAIQAEGSRAGLPTVVVRTTGCTHRCFVNKPGRNQPEVYPTEGERVKLSSVKEGDTLMAWDDNTASIVETKVVGVENNTCDTYVELKTEKGVFVVTEEHPFLTTRGWMFAKDLSESDELIDIKGNFRNSWRKTGDKNPMKDPVIALKSFSHPNTLSFANKDVYKKTVLTRLKKYGSLNPRSNFPEGLEKTMIERCKSRMKENNPMFEQDIVQKALKQRSRSGGGFNWQFGSGMTKVEAKFWNWIQSDENLRDLFWFTGDGSFSIKAKGKVKVPDFKLHGYPYFIEVGVQTGERGFRPSWNKYVEEIVELYKNSSLPGTKVIVINIDEGQEECLRKVKRFITNGIGIVSKRVFKNIKGFSTTNIHCEPHNNFLVKTPNSHNAVVSHNCYFGEGGWCDSWQTSIHPEKGQFSLQDVFDMYKRRPWIKEMMLTGGSPTMHPELVNQLSNFCHDNDIFLTIETEGSHFIKTDKPINLISLSPKFSNSVPKLGVETPKGKLTDQGMIDQHNKFRLNTEEIRKTIEYHLDYQFKPVVNPVEMPEIWNEIELFRNAFNIPKNKTWIMPPGDSREELIRVYPMVIDFCVENGFNFTGREHIIAYDKKRGV